ncbi:transposase [Geobacillus sp. GHH01]|nr:transposase [Geobacillus sp. GHH01]
MYFCIKQQLNGLTKEEYLTLRELCHIAKNMYNVGLYNVRQYYFEHKEFLNYEKNYHLAKTNRRVDYPIKSKGYRKKSTFPVECE